MLCRIRQETKSWKIYLGRLLPSYITNRQCGTGFKLPSHRSDHHHPPLGWYVAGYTHRQMLPCTRAHYWSCTGHTHRPWRALPAGATIVTLTALGARYLNPIPCSLLCMLMVYSRVTTSPMVEPPFFSLRGGMMTIKSERSLGFLNKLHKFLIKILVICYQKL